MKKKIVCFVIIFILVLFIYPHFHSKIRAEILAQNSLRVDETGQNNELVGKTESCFNYYLYGKASVSLTPDKSSYNSSEKIRLSGFITNANSFPLMNVTLYAHIRRINNNTLSFTNNGNYYIDRITLLNSLYFLPNEKKHINTELTVNNNYPNGEYSIEYYLFSPDGFHYGGRPFLEEDNAGNTLVTINSKKNPDVFFDIDNLKVNGQKQNLREFGKAFDDTNFIFEIPIIDRRTAKNDLSVKVAYYSFEDTFEDLKKKSDIITVSPQNQVVRTEFSIPANLSSAYVLVLQIDDPVKTIFKYRFAKNGTLSTDLRVNDIGITDYPIKESSKAYVCFHSPGLSGSPKTKVELSVLDGNKNAVDTVTEENVFPEKILAISLPLSNVKDKNNFFVKAHLSSENYNKTIIVPFQSKLFSDITKNIEIEQDASQNALSLKLLNASGEKIGKGGIIDQLIIRDNSNKIVDEKYTIPYDSEPISLSHLPSGTYKIDIVSGNIQRSKVIQFKNTNPKKTIKKTSSSSDNVNSSYGKPIKENKKTESADKQQNSSIFIILLIVFILIAGGIGAYIFLKRKKDENYY